VKPAARAALAPPRLLSDALRAPDARALGRTLVGIAVGLTALGLVMIYSWTAVRWSGKHDPSRALVRQLLWVVVAGGAAYVASRVPLAFLRRHAHHFLLAVLLLLAATLVPGLGQMRNNSRRWLEVGPLTVQASEVFKVAVVLYLADRLAKRHEGGTGDRTPWPALLAPVGIGVLLVLAEPDLGTALFVGATAVVLLGLGGVRPGQILALGATVLPLLVALAATKFAHVTERLKFFQGKASDQLQQAVIAVGSGGLLGAGLGAGTQKFGRVAEMQTDFIFALIGEETGFVGCAAVILAFMAFVVYGKRIAERAHASCGLFPFFVAAGATFVVGFQALVNVAVVTGSAPTKGVSLPFISVGGSNLVTAFLAVGLLVNVARHVSLEEGGDPLR
jgi:cell division protein FtsW